MGTSGRRRCDVPIMTETCLTNVTSLRRNNVVGESGVKSTHLRTLAQQTDSLTTHHHQEELCGGGQPWELPLEFKSEKGS